MISLAYRPEPGYAWAMARPLRVEYEGALYHVMSRGIERRDIVSDDRDRQRWLEWLQRTVETYDWQLHAFVLIENQSD